MLNPFQNHEVLKVKSLWENKDFLFKNTNCKIDPNFTSGFLQWYVGVCAFSSFS